MRDEHMLMYALVFVLGFMVARMMGCRLVEGEGIEREDLCYTANFDKGQCKGQIMEEEMRQFALTKIPPAEKALNGKLTNCDTDFTKTKCPDNKIAEKKGYKNALI